MMDHEAHAAGPLASAALKRYLTPSPVSTGLIEPYVGEFALRGAENIAEGMTSEDAYRRFQSQVHVHNRLRVAAGQMAVAVPTSAEFSAIVDFFLGPPSVCASAPDTTASA